MTGNIPRYKIMLTKDIGEERISELEELKDKPLALTSKEANDLVKKWRAECRSIRLDKDF
tara:strand:+ start:1433 stop:1612 length:180 start_codon:yes stop_codon:yes gene_type:complete